MTLRYTLCWCQPYECQDATNDRTIYLVSKPLLHRSLHMKTITVLETNTLPKTTSAPPTHTRFWHQNLYKHCRSHHLLPEMTSSQPGQQASESFLGSLLSGKTPAVKNMEAAWTRAGAGNNHTPGSASKLGSQEQPENKSSGVGGKDFKDNISDQRVEVGFLFPEKRKCVWMMCADADGDSRVRLGSLRIRCWMGATEGSEFHGSGIFEQGDAIYLEKEGT